MESCGFESHPAYMNTWYWQFENGTLAELKTARDVLTILDVYKYQAWDRSLGAWVVYG